MVSKYLVEHGYIAIKQTKHGLFMFNRNDLFIGRSLDLYGEWSESEIVLLSNFLQPGDTVIDVGANIGTHAIAFARAVGAGGSVVAFEPQRLPFHLLCGNAAINCLGHVQCRQQAVGSRRGTARVPVLSPDQPRNFGAVPLNTEFAGDVVEMVTLDSLELASCRLIKIDVEGMEPEVIQGAQATITAHRPLLFVENNTLEWASRTISAVLDAGYKPWWHLALYYNEANYFGNPKNVFAKYQPEANLLCLPDATDPGAPELIECEGIEDNWQKALLRGIAAGKPQFMRQRA